MNLKDTGTKFMTNLIWNEIRQQVQLTLSNR